MSKEIKVFVGVYTHKHGTDVDVYPTYEAAKEAAKSAMADIARTYWEDRVDVDTPEDHSKLTDDEVIAAYYVGNKEEYFEIFERPLSMA